jgi:hypothetical protein
MPWLPIYMNQSDLQALLTWLNDENDIAFIISDGHKKWKAVHTLEVLYNQRYCLWHSASGPLPLLRKIFPDGKVQNPWKGWKEKLTGADSTCPYFGAGHPGVYWLNIKTTSNRDANTIGLSSFEWIGNRYRIIGNPAPTVTKKWWERLGRWVKKQAIQIPRKGYLNENEPEIWAMPGALEEIKSGRERDDNP